MKNLLIAISLAFLASHSAASPSGESGLYIPTWDGATATQGRVMVFDSRKGKFVTTVVGPLADDIIQGMTVGPDGLLQVVAVNTVTNTNPRILRYELGGQFVDEFVGPGLASEGGLGEFIDIFASLANLGADTPTDIVFGPKGDLFVIGRSPTVPASAIFQFDGRTGGFVRRFVEFDQGLGTSNTGILFVDRACSKYGDEGLGNRCFGRVRRK